MTVFEDGCTHSEQALAGRLRVCILLILWHFQEIVVHAFSLLVWQPGILCLRVREEDPRRAKKRTQTHSIPTKSLDHEQDHGLSSTP
jgi:hypothetical protein